MPTQKDIEEVLKNIPDPEIGVSLWDLGLIYKINIDNQSGVIGIIMTLTTIGCPLFSLIAGPIKKETKKLEGVTEVRVELTFEPPWSTDMMTEKAKTELGMI